MNKGTTIKWLNTLKHGNYHFGNGQLKSIIPDSNGNLVDAYDPFGVLLDFLNPNGWQRHELHGWTFEGEVFKMPESYRKSCKMKTIWGNFVSDNGYETSLVNVIDGCSSFDFPIYYIEKYYEQF